VALRTVRGRLRLSLPVEEWVEVCESIDALAFVPVDNAISLRSTALPSPLHADPADRIIAVTAVGLHMPLVTKDARLLAYQPVGDREVEARIGGGHGSSEFPPPRAGKCRVAHHS
jgi:PIN domain nuclease of toxin-antitoxin system